MVRDLQERVDMLEGRNHGEVYTPPPLPTPEAVRPSQPGWTHNPIKGIYRYEGENGITRYYTESSVPDSGKKATATDPEEELPV